MRTHERQAERAHDGHPDVAGAHLDYSGEEVVGDQGVGVAGDLADLQVAVIHVVGYKLTIARRVEPNRHAAVVEVIPDYDVVLAGEDRRYGGDERAEVVVDGSHVQGHKRVERSP